MPTCAVCNDTHSVTLSDGKGGTREGLCIRCPIPCEDCRGRSPSGYCASSPCSCKCHVKEAPAKPAASRLALLVKQLQNPEMREWLAKKCCRYIIFAIRRGEVFDPVRRRSAEATKLMVDILPKVEFPKLHELFDKWAGPTIREMMETSDLLEAEAECTCPPDEACARHLPMRIQALTQRFYNLTGQRLFVSVDQDGKAVAVRARSEER
jgi:hypothetical protein